MNAKTGNRTGEQARRWMHQPVCVVLNDGSCCVGWITDVDRETLTLSGSMEMDQRNQRSLKRTGSPVISAFGPGLPAAYNAEGGGWGSLFGFSPPGERGPAGWGGFVSFVQQVWPGVQIGLGIVRAVMPLMGGFKI